MARELRVDEIREQFLQHMHSIIEHWALSPDVKTPEGVNPLHWRVRGALYSALVALDGESAALPGFIVAPKPHPEDRAYRLSKGRDWFPENHEAGIRGDISGCLHDMLGSA